MCNVVSKFNKIGCFPEILLILSFGRCKLDSPHGFPRFLGFDSKTVQVGSACRKREYPPLRSSTPGHKNAVEKRAASDPHDGAAPRKNWETFTENMDSGYDKKGRGVGRSKKICICAKKDACSSPFISEQCKFPPESRINTHHQGASWMSCPTRREHQRS